MEVSYQHANPHDGRESYLVRFHHGIHDRTTCVLVDAGDGVDVDDLLGEDEYLSAICLTHAHLDHYRTLGSNLRDGAPVYATPETARAITTRLDTDAEHAALENAGDLRGAFEPITDWTTVTSDVRVHPVPAGHAPGACGFLVQFADGDDHYHLLATGDFTTRRAAGYPGLQTDLPVDVVFLTAATRPDVPERLTGAVATVVERATAGSTVLTSASGSNGVHLAYLLAHAGVAEGRRLPVTVAGRVATLWDAFEYEHPSVDVVPTFAEPDEVLERGRVTIAGPEVPVAGSSERLFEAIENDGGATLVQVTSGAFDPVRSAGCTVDTYELSNHPDEATIDGVVDELTPIHVVVTHQRGNAADRYKDKYDSFVWVTDDSKEYTLYEDGEWSGPPWVTDATRRRVRSRLYRNDGASVGRSFETADVPLPGVQRRDDVDLEAEGLDTTRLDPGSDADVATLERSTGDDAGRAPADDARVEADGSKDGADDALPVEDDDTDVEYDSTGENDGSLTAIVERLDRIEAAMSGRATRATVVDAGDDVTLLRLNDGEFAGELAHGQSVEVVVRDATAVAASEDDADVGDGENAN